MGFSPSFSWSGPSLPGYMGSGGSSPRDRTGATDVLLLLAIAILAVGINQRQEAELNPVRQPVVE